MAKIVSFRSTTSAGNNRRELHTRMLIALRIVDGPAMSAQQLASTASLYMFEEDLIVWPLLQALAYNHLTPPAVLQQLHEKRRWYLDIGLVHNRSTPKDIITSMAHLPVEETDNLADKNAEIRRIARRRLGLPGFAAARATNDGEDR